MSKVKWSKYQQAMFDDVANGSGHTVILARAGSGKTTSILESFKYIPSGKKALMVAFNKSIAQELRDRAGYKHYLDISTLHSFGFRAIKEAYGDVVLDNKKTVDIVTSFIGKKKDLWDLNQSICRCITLCKLSLVDSEEGVSEIIDNFSIETFELDSKSFIDIVLKSMNKCKEIRNVVDFDDMIWFPFINKIKVKTYDFVFVDEMQDLNRSQMAMVLASCKKSGRIIAVGDNFQCIYSWIGADVETIDKFKNILHAKELKMPISYRCPRKIVYLAQKIVPDFQHTPNAEYGEITKIFSSSLLNYVKPGDFILSRTNAPLIKYCMSLLKNGIPANIQGRDVGNNLLWFIKKSKKKTITELLKYVAEWREREVARLIELKRDPTSYRDKAECLINLCDGCDSIKELEKNIKALFDDTDDNAKVILSTTHKAKGLERDRVFVLEDTYRFNTFDFDFGSDGGNREEKNLFYVAITRAKKELFLVRKKSKYTNYDHKSHFPDQENLCDNESLKEEFLYG